MRRLGAPLVRRSGRRNVAPRVLVLSLALFLPACKRDQAAPAADYGLVHMQVGNQPFTLELAATDKTRQHGLMHRQSLPERRGMLFVFSDEQPRSFWMRNTLIPLDIVYLDKNGKVVSISQMKPLDETGVHSAGPAKYAIEMNEGAAAKAGVKVGDVLDIPPAARESLDDR
jgi:uncharacterized membrane protein (UPF0127 family)